MFNHSIIEGLKSVIPARSTFSERNANFGVEIKPTVLEKQKYENEQHSVEVNPNTYTGSYFVNVKLSDELSNKQLLSDVISTTVGTANNTISSSGFIESPHTASISLGNSYQTSSGYLKDSPAKNHYHPPFLQPGGYVATIENPYTGSSINIVDRHNFAGSGIQTSSNGTIDYGTEANQSYVSIHKNWGTSSADEQFINFAAPTGSYGTFNTYAIETRFVFHAVGETEYYSGSIGDESNFDNSSRFYNRLYLTDGVHGTVTYDSKNFGTGLGIVTGRMMGKTRYFTTGSDGNIILPSNHVSRYVDHYLNNMINGTQNVDPGFLSVQYEDYSTASFYRVNVTGGENQIKVVSGGPDGVDVKGNILYSN